MTAFFIAFGFFVLGTCVGYLVVAFLSAHALGFFFIGICVGVYMFALVSINRRTGGWK